MRKRKSVDLVKYGTFKPDLLKDPAFRRCYEANLRLKKEFAPWLRAIRESERITADDLKIIVG